ncbi:ethanolamine ammonia-lyase subunit EutC [Mucilaginibacter terrae]|uniref:Ethanolamine ammonia-lyase small subunit n=1 Tax=Mucilaginibacter terrae TaxID=1955052 RepID=A0ABU3GSZ2_9SPHI|nr:ethanolamine ammonia-lyase subunit EutC [Mucilaginibacter terrae]MDT3401780.1 ethanolamine ammonia-lyase small subunit [Mucilaginibacter terrae]
MENEEGSINRRWQNLQQYTAARIALGRTGNSIPLKQSLELKLAHAHARDAIYSHMDVEGLSQAVKAYHVPVINVHSCAELREQYLQRPDLGRLLQEQSIQNLQASAGDYDICVILADGLSAEALNENAVPLLNLVLPLLKEAGYKLSPIIFAQQARVALADHVGHHLGAKFSIIFIGERPGLSAADSIGAYLTYNPKPGLTDEARNCVSNIRPQGLPFEVAAQKIFYLVQEAFRLKLTGVNLKDNAGLLK